MEASDSDVLRDTASWLAAAYSRGVLLSGLMYVHQSTAFRMSRSPMKYMSVWRKLCGESQLGATVMATTYWTAENWARSLRVEYDLITGEDFLGLANGSWKKMFRQDEGKKSAAKIIEYLVQRKQKVVLEIQRQVVDDKMKLEDTAAGISIQENLADQISSCEKELGDLREDLDYVTAQKDTEWQGRVPKRIPVLEKSSEHLLKRRCNLDPKGETIHGDVKAIELDPPLELVYHLLQKRIEFRKQVCHFVY
jgi:hypothetical protein